MATIGRFTTDPLNADSWKCEWSDSNGTECKTGGSTQQHTGSTYLRHVCYGHGPEYNPKSTPVAIYICDKHSLEFRRTHGLDRNPDWIRKQRIADDYRSTPVVAAGAGSV